ncbi:MAG: phosphatidate cytidylyltransferase [Anaerovoracaceae bacterium]
MKTRILSSVILLPLLVVLYYRGPLLWAACLLIAVVGVSEFYRGFEVLKIRPNHWIGWISAVALYALAVFGEGLHMYMLWFFAVVAASLLYLFKIEERQLADGMATVMGVFYVVFFSFHVVLIDRTGMGNMIWLVILTAFGTDVMAYFTGYFLGKHKLCPKISPKKTIEGAIGGIAGSVILCFVFGYLLSEESMIHFIFIGFFGSIVAQAGDLTASVFKRKMGIKDYGNLIPGHGGILDRFDSVLFTAPFVYYYIMLVIF